MGKKWRTRGCGRERVGGTEGSQGHGRERVGGTREREKEIRLDKSLHLYRKPGPLE